MRRDPGGKVIRQYRSSSTSPSAAWVWVEDFVYRDGLLLGSERVAEEGGRRHYHLDHLGSPRLITGTSGSVISEHDFLPFGEERTAIGQHQAKGYDREEPLRFTGHERDFDNTTPNDSSSYIDSMHARYSAADAGRFLSVDPLMTSRALRAPQGWNRYSYVENDPMSRIDPFGMKMKCVTTPTGEKCDVEGDIPKTPTLSGSFKTLMDLMWFAAGRLPSVSAADARSAHDLSNTPVMDQIREQYKKNNCVDREKPYFGDFQYAELATTPPFSTGQMVGSFGAKIRTMDNGMIVVLAFNTWGLESATRFPGTSNRHNASVEQILGGAPLQYPKSVFENRSGGAMSTAKLNYVWIEGSPCGQ